MNTTDWVREMRPVLGDVVYTGLEFLTVAIEIDASEASMNLSAAQQAMVRQWLDRLLMAVVGPTGLHVPALVEPDGRAPTRSGRTRRACDVRGAAKGTAPVRVEKGILPSRAD